MTVSYTLNEIWRYPVKSMGGERLEFCTVSSAGIDHDRHWALVDNVTGRILSAKTVPVLMLCSARLVGEGLADVTLPDGGTVRSDDGRIDQRLSEILGRSVTLEARGGCFDASPLMVMTRAGIRLLELFLPRIEMDIRRFRPNLLLEDSAGLSEAVELTWIDREFCIGGVWLRASSECERCSMVTHALADVEKAPKILELLVRNTDAKLGLYVEIIRAGELNVGSPVQWAAQR